MKLLDHLLLILGEECSEIAQAVSKILRFSPYERQSPAHPHNLKKLQLEYNDMLAIVELLAENGIVLYRDKIHISRKKRKVRQYITYSSSLKKVELNDLEKSYICVLDTPESGFFKERSNEHIIPIEEFLRDYRNGKYQPSSGNGVYVSEHYITGTYVFNEGGAACITPEWAVGVLWKANDNSNN